MIQEQADSAFMHKARFGKGQDFSKEAAQALAQGVVETLNMVGGAFGIGSAMLGGGQDVMITFQIISA